MYDIVIVGAGPAGLTAAIYARRSNKKVLVLEANSYGGQIINTIDIENYPVERHISGYDFATKLYNQAKDLGSEIKFERVVKINNLDNKKEVITSNNKYECKSIILATGSRVRELGLDREKELIGKGISYCATCDGAFFRDKDVAVVGAGNTAVGEALYLSNIVNKVYVIIRGNSFKAEEASVNELKEKSNVEFIYDSSVTKLNGDNKLESIIINDKDEINTSGLFIAIGRVPENEIFSDLINLDKYGYIVSDENCHTNIEGIFVSGDNRTKELRQLVTATSDGAVAATEATKYVNRH